MTRPTLRRLAVTLAAAATFVAMNAGSANAASTHHSGTLSDGTTWIADVPSNWNGSLILYSHGFGTLLAADAPDPVTQAALLSDGYALAGSSEAPPTSSLWTLGTALRDQFNTLSVVEHTLLPSAPQEVYAFGTSMGGLISALEDQDSNGRLGGALTTCGIVAGANNLNQYQLDGEYAIAKLLAPTESIQLVNFTGTGFPNAQALGTAFQLGAAATSAQATPQGRARLALAMALLNVSPWGDTLNGSPGPQPSVYDYVGQEQGQFDDVFGPGFNGMDFIEAARPALEQAAGGDSAGTTGVNFWQLVHESSYYPEVRALYEEAGLDLKSDTATLDEGENIAPDRAAYIWNEQTSVPTGRLQVPELDMKTISDQLVPVQQERYYAELVRQAGDSALLAQSFVAAQGHCNFTPAELVAGVQALASRVNTGSWGNVATAAQLDSVADALPSALGGGAFIPFWPERLTAAIPPPFGPLFPELPFGISALP
jgi:hypothetical protein